MRSDELGVRSSFLIPLSSFLILLLLASCPSQPEPVGEPEITDRQLSPNTRRLLHYLSDQYGKYTISGQMDTAWTENNSMDMIARVYADTGRYPAIKGFDFIGLPQSWAGYGRNQVDEAIEWWDGKNRMDGASPAAKLLPDRPKIHGIVTFCWHWRTGSKSDFYTNNTDFRIPMSNGKLDIASAAGQTIKSDLDKVAALLQLLKDEDIPVLWRPLHEASGGWFWWGASGPAACIALWEYMYDYLTNTKRLDNLIWVWNGQNAAWYPNPGTVDIVGYDVYSGAKNYLSQEVKFGETQVMPPERNRMVALTENGAIPDPDNCKADNAMWLWFLTWNDARNTNGETHRDNFWTGEYHNTQAHKEHVYNHDLVITLDELPDLTQYRLE
jgi:mannan endo-1,4-beta-mannosidase